MPRPRWSGAPLFESIPSFPPKCPRSPALAGKIIDGSNEQEPVAFYFPGDDLFTPHERRKCLPLGNQTSQFFANIYLNSLDHVSNRDRNDADNRNNNNGFRVCR